MNSGSRFLHQPCIGAFGLTFWSRPFCSTRGLFFEQQIGQQVIRSFTRRDRESIPSSEVFDIVRQQRKLVNDRYGGDRCIRNSHHNSLASVITFEETRHPRDWPGDVVVLQAAQEFLSGGFLFGSKTRIHFGDVDRTTGPRDA
jgi:hypothetical protein